MIKAFIHAFLRIPTAFAVPAVFLLSAAETAMFVGVLIPGEVAVILGGVLASRRHVPLWAVLLAGTIGPMTGDSIGYFLGRRYDASKLKGKSKERWERVRKGLDEKGGPAVFFGRFAAFLRSIVPAAAGAAKIPYGRFLLFDVPACLLWGAASVLFGYFAGTNYRVILHFAGAIAIAVSLVLGFFLIRYLRLRKSGAKGNSKA